jgi:GDPmannose 4,6-dehydratase
METKKIIVTGSTGQLGSFMIDYLLENTQHTVIAAIRRTSQIIDSHIRKHEKNNRFRIAHFDLIDAHSINTLIKNEQPDYFINFGAQTFVHDSWSNPISHFETNAISMIHILEAVRNFCKKCKVYSSGSSEQFGDVIYAPQNMSHPFRPRSPYGAAKAACHNIVKVWRESYGLYVVQGILFNNESCRRQEYFVTRKISKGVARILQALKSRNSFDPIELGNLDAKRDWSDSCLLYTSDAADD